MITEDYVSFETAKLLKEKGFEQPIDYEKWFPKITLQMAMKWLREVYNIAIETEWEHLWYAYIKPMTSKPSEEDYYQCESSKYEEACEAAIKYCLENLI